jgi:hypothetical protein
MDELGIGFDTNYDINDFDIKNLDLSNIYSSGVIKYYLSDLVEEKLLDLKVLPTVGYDAMKTKFKTVDKVDLNCTDGYFNETELKDLLTFLEDVLGISFDNTELEDPNYYLGKIAGNSQDAVENRASLENSYLARAIISHQILNFIEGPNNHFLIDSIAAHEKNGDVVIRILKYSEIDSLLGMIEGDLTDYNPDTISLSNIKELVASNDEADTNIKSFILNASISDELTGNGNTIQIPEDIYDQARGIINPYHLGLLIDALIALVGDNGVHFESFDEFRIPDNDEQFEIIASSIIMRASIGHNLKISDGNAILGIVNDSRYGSIIKNSYGNNVLLFTKEETINIFRSISSLFTSGEEKTFNISMERVIRSADATVFNSNLLCVAASTYLEGKGIISAIELVTGKSPENKEIIKCNSSIVSDVPVFTPEDVIYVLDKIKNTGLI